MNIYIGKIRFYNAKPNNEQGNKLALSFYTRTDDLSNGKFVTTRIFYSNIDKCFSNICALAYKAMFANNTANFEIVEKHTFSDDSNLSTRYSFKIVFKHRSLTH